MATLQSRGQLHRERLSLYCWSLKTFLQSLFCSYQKFKTPLSASTCFFSPPQSHPYFRKPGLLKPYSKYYDYCYVTCKFFSWPESSWLRHCANTQLKGSSCVKELISTKQQETANGYRERSTDKEELILGNTTTEFQSNIHPHNFLSLLFWHRKGCDQLSLVNLLKAAALSLFHCLEEQKKLIGRV